MDFKFKFKKIVRNVSKIWGKFYNLVIFQGLNLTRVKAEGLFVEKIMDSYEVCLQ